jgi:NAD(P)-dependent dehydrogenase (short-subunit alcohol dehydrogenase family)
MRFNRNLNEFEQSIHDGQSTKRYNSLMSFKPLSGKVGLVTGGAKRLGRAAALALANAGADLAVTYWHSETEVRCTTKELENAGARVLAVSCDVTNPKNVSAAVKQVVSELGVLDILVNNAGAYETASFEDITVQQWDSMFGVNVRGPFLMSQAAQPHLRRRKGRIINLGSLGGLRAWSSHAHYCSSKAALHMLTKAMAKALAPEIAVNCVAPGMIDLGEKSAAAFMSRVAKQTPMQRNGTGHDVAAAILFFATAPSFITGQVLYVDGGLGL